MPRDGRVRFENVVYQSWTAAPSELYSVLRFLVTGTKHPNLNGTLVLERWPAAHRLELHLFDDMQEVRSYTDCPLVFEGPDDASIMTLLRWFRALLTDDVDYVRQQLRGHVYQQYFEAGEDNDGA